MAWIEESSENVREGWTVLNYSNKGIGELMPQLDVMSRVEPCAMHGNRRTNTFKQFIWVSGVWNTISLYSKGQIYGQNHVLRECSFLHMSFWPRWHWSNVFSTFLMLCYMACAKEKAKLAWEKCKVALLVFSLNKDFKYLLVDSKVSWKIEIVIWNKGNENIRDNKGH